MYDQLAAHEIPWTDQSVKDALTEMARIVGDAQNVAGGVQGALQTDFPTSVTQVFADPPAAAQALVTYLTTPEAAEIWAAEGGFASLNRNMDTSVYPDEITQTTAGALAETEVFRFDLSDLQPAAFGGTVGQGLFKLFQDFLRNPDDVDGITQQMETAAAQAFG